MLVYGDAVRARQVANQIALRDTIEKYGVKKVFTFHRDVKSAQSFVSAGPEGVGTHLNGSAGFQPASSSGVPAASPQTAGGDARITRTQDACATFQTFHVNGSMPTARRERELRDFRAAARAVVSNARCLTEGVDEVNREPRQTRERRIDAGKFPAQTCLMAKRCVNTRD